MAIFVRPPRCRKNRASVNLTEGYRHQGIWGFGIGGGRNDNAFLVWLHRTLLRLRSRGDCRPRPADRGAGPPFFRQSGAPKQASAGDEQPTRSPSLLPVSIPEEAIGPRLAEHSSLPAALLSRAATRPLADRPPAH